jgi:hypothetical protein
MNNSKNKNKNLIYLIIVIISIFIIIYFLIKQIRLKYYNYNNIDNFYNFDKDYYENVNYEYESYNYGDLEYTTPLQCEKHFNFMKDPNFPRTKGCYIKLDDLKKYYNPYLKNCPDIWNYNIEIDGVQYCRRDGSNLPINNLN